MHRLTGTVTIGDVLASLQFFLDTSGERSIGDVNQLPPQAFARVTGKPLALQNGILWQRFDAVAIGAADT